MDAHTSDTNETNEETTAPAPQGDPEAAAAEPAVMFGTVKEGFIGRHLTFVPLTGITIGPDNLQVPVSKEQVKEAPNIALQGGELSQPDESALYHHYQLNYTPPDTQSGRRLARR